jgi:hypothetical protein
MFWKGLKKAIGSRVETPGDYVGYFIRVLYQLPPQAQTCVRQVSEFDGEENQWSTDNDKKTICVVKPHKKNSFRIQDFRMTEIIINDESIYPRYGTTENELKRNLIMETSKQEVDHHRTVKPRKVLEVKEEITAVEDEVSFFQDFVAGGIAGSASVIVGHPFDTIKVCM